MARRAFDVVVAGAALLVASPLLLAAVLAIRLESRGSPIYRQRRVGKDGRAFDVLKLRTMVTGAEHMGAGLAVSEGDTRITRVGRLLRRTSLDEVPNLVNVLRGEMAIVGPRPTVPVQVDRYTERQRGRLAVKPGITGWAQVNGRTELPWDERIELDLWYIEHRSWRLDLRIMLAHGADGPRRRRPVPRRRAGLARSAQRLLALALRATGEAPAAAATAGAPTAQPAAALGPRGHCVRPPKLGPEARGGAPRGGPRGVVAQARASGATMGAAGRARTAAVARALTAGAGDHHRRDLRRDRDRLRCVLDGAVVDVGRGGGRRTEVPAMQLDLTHGDVARAAGAAGDGRAHQRLGGHALGRAAEPGQRGAPAPPPAPTPAADSTAAFSPTLGTTGSSAAIPTRWRRTSTSKA